MPRDDATSSFSLSVQDLLWALPQDREPLPSPFTTAYRMAMGHEAHRRPDHGLCWDSAKDPTPSETAREVAVSTALQPEDIADPHDVISINGRIDRLVRWHRERVRICEIKSVFLPETRFLNITPDRYPAYVRQTQLYAWIFHRENPLPNVEARLVLLNQATHRHRIFEIVLDWEELDYFARLHAHYLFRLHRQNDLRIQEKKAKAQLLKNWPFPLYRGGQKEFIDSAANALIHQHPLTVEAPTGMGKTVCALQSSLLYAAETGKKILFLTAKGTQQNHVLETARLISAHAFPHVSLQLLNKRAACINDRFLCQPSSCTFLDRFGDRWAEAWVSNDPPILPHDQSPTVVRQLSEKLVVCPFEAAKQLLQSCDLLVADYNYLFDPDVRLREFQGEEHAREWAVIVDEAHNLVNRACDYYSATLDFSGAEDWILLLRNLSGTELEEAFSSWIDELQNDFLRLWNESANQTSGRDPNRRTADFSTVPWEHYQQQLQEICARYYLDRLENARFESDDPVDQFQWEFNRFCLLVQDPSLDQIPSPSAQWIHATEKAGFRIELFCLDPGPRLAPIWNSLGGALLMSATLTPMDFFQERLGLPTSSFQARYPSPFSEDQRPVYILPFIDTTFVARRKSSADLASVIEDAATACEPANIAVFFPSFAYLEMVLNQLRPDLNRKILVQTGQMGKDQRDEILECLRNPQRGYLLMGVLGGIFAEGVDYRGSMLEGVIIVGPGLPSIGPERDAMSTYYEQLGLNGFTSAFAIPGIQRVLQAVGRLIRSEQDRGFALLVGKRFVKSPYWELLPEEWRKRGKSQLSPPDWLQQVQRFAETHFPPPPK